jgi:CRISPR-associated protein (TIGR03984 family)
MNDNNAVQVNVSPLELPDPFVVNTWLAQQSTYYKWLLVHTYAGIIWGRRFEDGWKLSSGRISSSPPLMASTVLQLRLFSEAGEIFIWRAGDRLRARQVLEEDTEGESLDVIDETQILWGSRGEQIDDHFTRLEDGTRGLAHAVPLALGDFDARSWRPVQLHVRHYLTRHPETGLARIGFSRLRTLNNKEVNGNGS